MKAKLIDNELIYPTNFMKIGENWVSNPTEEMLTSLGYKEVRYQEIDKKTVDFEETDTEIIILIKKLLRMKNRLIQLKIIYHNELYLT